MRFSRPAPSDSLRSDVRGIMKNMRLGMSLKETLLCFEGEFQLPDIALGMRALHYASLPLHSAAQASYSAAQALNSGVQTEYSVHRHYILVASALSYGA